MIYTEHQIGKDRWERDCRGKGEEENMEGWEEENGRLGRKIDWEEDEVEGERIGRGGEDLKRKGRGEKNRR